MGMYPSATIIAGVKYDEFNQGELSDVDSENLETMDEIIIDEEDSCSWHGSEMELFGLYAGGCSGYNDTADVDLNKLFTTLEKACKIFKEKGWTGTPRLIMITEFS